MIVGITISNSQVYLLGFFSLKSTPYNSWVMRVFIVWVKKLVKHFIFLPNKMFRKYPTRWPFSQSTHKLDNLA